MTNCVNRLIYLIRLLAAIASVFVLSACDGGLFGTGDGSTIDEIDAGAPGIQTPPAQTPEPPDTEIPGPPGGTGTEDMHLTIVFDNLLSGSNSATPFVSLLNISERTLNITAETHNTPLFDSDVQPGTFSDPASIDAGENFLDIIDTQSMDRVFSIRPLNAGASSVTTLIARSLNDDDIDVITLRTRTVSETPSVALVRIVQANLLDTTDSPATFTLQPAGLNPGSSEVRFPDVSVSTAHQAAYQPISAGTFQLIDESARLDPTELTVESGEIYTLIIVDKASAALIIQTDSELLDPS